MEDPWFWLDGEPRSEVEAAFVQAVRKVAVGWSVFGVQARDTQIWLHRYADGRPWLLAHVDFVEEVAIRRVLRLDLDDEGYRGGWSPAALNWDAGVPAREAGVELAGPWGVNRPRSGVSTRDFAASAADWIHSIVQSFSSMGTR